MKHFFLTGAATLALAANGALAAGLDRSGQSVMAVFGPDNSGSVSFGLVKPSITGRDVGGGDSYSNVGDDYTQFSFTYTNTVNDRFNYSVILDQPYGANVTYGGDPTSSNLAGTGADLSSTAINFVGRYKIGDRFSVFGGVSAQRIKATVNLSGLAYTQAVGVPASFSGAARELSALSGVDVAPDVLATALAGGTTALDPVFAGVSASEGFGADAATGRAIVQSLVDDAQADFGANGYRFELKNSTRPTYFIGAAYEVPDIALRIAGTYRFETTHKSEATEYFGSTNAGTNDIEFKTPQSFNLEAQTGVAPGTLVTFGYRWSEFSAVDLVPAVLGSDLVNLDDAERYTLGVARQFSDKFAASATISYEPKGDKLVSPLGPTNGLLGLSLGARYTDGNMNLSGGINYSKLGDANPEVGDVAVANFTDNHVVGVGFKLDFTF